MKKNVPKTEFGKNLRRMRKDRRMTGPELGEKLGIAQPTITGWERGTFEPRFHNLVALADVFGVSIDEFFGRKPPSASDTAIVEKSPHATVVQHSAGASVDAQLAALTAVIEKQQRTIADLAAALAAKK